MERSTHDGTRPLEMNLAYCYANLGLTADTYGDVPRGIYSAHTTIADVSLDVRFRISLHYNQHVNSPTCNIGYNLISCWRNYYNVLKSKRRRRPQEPQRDVPRATEHRRVSALGLRTHWWPDRDFSR